MLFYYDCANCGKRKTCEGYDEGTFCTQWCSYAPETEQAAPNPEGWEPEDED